MKLRLLLLFAGLLSLNSIARAQAILLRDFSLAESADGHVLVKWTVAAGFSCADLEVQSSTDSVHFNTIYTYSGICGSQTEDLDYSWIYTDAAPNQKIYYRLGLGLNGYSRVLSYRKMVFGAAGFLIFPNPVDETTVLYLDKSPGKTVALSITSLQGTYKTVLTEFADEQIPLGKLQLPPGLYAFELKDSEGEVRTGRFLIAR